MSRFSPIAIAALSIPIVTIASCATPQPEIDPELSQAIASVRYMTGPRWLSRSSFQVTYPDGKPSDYVNYIFSDFGIAEWPLALDEFEEEQMRSANIPPLPRNVALVPNNPDPSLELKLQVVLRAADAEGVVIVEAYKDPQAAPVATVSRKIGPQVAGE